MGYFVHLSFIKMQFTNILSIWCQAQHQPKFSLGSKVSYSKKPLCKLCDCPYLYHLCNNIYSYGCVFYTYFGGKVSKGWLVGVMGLTTAPQKSRIQRLITTLIVAQPPRKPRPELSACVASPAGGKRWGWWGPHPHPRPHRSGSQLGSSSLVWTSPKRAQTQSNWGPKGKT